MNLLVTAIIFLSLIYSSISTATETKTVVVKSLTWYHNSKAVCVRMESLRSEHTVITPLLLHMTLSFKSNLHHTIELGNHACHAVQSGNTVCGILPDDIDSSSFLIPEKIFGTMQIIHLPNRNDNDTEYADINIPITTFSSHGKTAALSLQDICQLHVDKCNICHTPCAVVMEDSGEVMCYGYTPTLEETRVRLTPRDEEMLFDTDLMNVTGVAFPNRNVFCVVLKRPVHRLGNIFRFVQYSAEKTLVTYVDENGEGGQYLHLSDEEVCVGKLAMEKEEDIDAVCARYEVMPKLLKSFQGSLTIQGFNEKSQVYSFQKNNFHAWVNQPVIVKDDQDPCREQNVCPPTECTQTCQALVTSNTYQCDQDGRERYFVKSKASRVSKTTTTTTMLPSVEKTKSNLPNLLRIPTSAYEEEINQTETMINSQKPSTTEQDASDIFTTEYQPTSTHKFSLMATGHVTLESVKQTPPSTKWPDKNDIPTSTPQRKGSGKRKKTTMMTLIKTKVPKSTDTPKTKNKLPVPTMQPTTEKADTNIESPFYFFPNNDISSASKNAGLSLTFFSLLLSFLLY